VLVDDELEPDERARIIEAVEARVRTSSVAITSMVSPSSRG
jgi:hypothetical protein